MVHQGLVSLVTAQDWPKASMTRVGELLRLASAALGVGRSGTRTGPLPDSVTKSQNHGSRWVNLLPKSIQLVDSGQFKRPDDAFSTKIF
jgi:hypothetical protein